MSLGSNVSKRTNSKMFRTYVWPSKVNLTILGWKISFIIVNERLFFILKKFNSKRLNISMMDFKRFI